MAARHLFWIIPLSLTIGWIATMTRDSAIEDSKNAAFMMKACVDAGGQWRKNYGPTWDCVRPSPEADQ